MRGGERLVKECSWMRGICSRLYHSTEKYKTFSCRCPSSVMVNNRFRSADYLPCQLFNFGMIATGNHNFERFAALCNTLPGEAWALRAGACASIRVLAKIQSCGRMLSAPTTAAAKPPTGRLIVDPYSGRVRLSERSIFPPVSEQSRHRAGQGTNVLVQSP